MPSSEAPTLLLVAALAGLAGGLVLLMRGLLAYRDAARVASVATSRTDALAAGEVRVSGIVEALGFTLRSPLQRVPSVWFRATVDELDDTPRTLLRREMAVPFLLRDDRGTVRVVPHATDWRIEPSYDETSDHDGDAPPGLDLADGLEMDPVGPVDREAAIASLLTVRPRAGRLDAADDDSFAMGILTAAREPRKRYREARLEPGQTVTIVGMAIPASDVAEAHAQATLGDPFVDPAISADLAAAREAGTLAPDAETAWGNAAIPGFGIGRPTREPDLHDDAHEPALATADEADLARGVFEPDPASLVVTSAHGLRLLVHAGTPAEVASSHDVRFVLGLAGGVVSVLSAAGLAVLLGGAL